MSQPDINEIQIKQAYLAGAMNVARAYGYTGQRLEKVATHVAVELRKRAANSKTLLDEIRATLKAKSAPASA